MPAGNRLDRETVSRPERVQTSDRCFGARESGELLKEGKHMRISEEIHASCRPRLNWNGIAWNTVEKKVKELQMRIAQAVRNRMTGSLQNRKRLAKCLSRVRGNSHARFLGGLGLETAPGYPAMLSG